MAVLRIEAHLGRLDRAGRYRFSAMDILADIHDWTRWIVLFMLVGAAGWGIVSFVQKRSFEGRGDAVYAIAMTFFDIQVTIGLILWIAGRMPPRVDHPWIMLVAVLVGHAALILGRRRPAQGHAYAGFGLLLALLLVAGGIPWGG